MNATPARLRRLAIKLAHHASRVLPGKNAAWADAMRHELDHIADNPAALRWALGCVLASYRIRLSEVSRPSAWTSWRIGAAGTVVVMILTGLALEAHAGGQAEPQPVFSETACDLPNLSPQLRPRLRCGTVSVPRDYDNPAAGQFKLAVVVAQSAQQPALADPLLYISGGPGGPLTVYASYQANHPYAPDRDLILVDQRGMGRSEPSICPGLKGEYVDAMMAMAIQPDAKAQARHQAIFKACREQSTTRGLDLRDFGTSVTVEDLNLVRQALGVTRWNVFGVSYGTTVAMTLMARYPDTVRSAILDSVNPPDPILPPWSANVAEARDAFFASCTKDEACNAAFPDLAGLYRETLKRLDRSPLSVALPPYLHYPDNHGLLTASLFEFAVGHLVYYPTFYPGLPRLIAAVHDGDTTMFASSLASLLAAVTDRNTGSDFAANAAVDCRDRPHYRKPLADDADIFEQMSLAGICDGWSDLGPSPVIPLGTKVPTLVLAGQFDPNARPAVGRHVAELIGSHAQWIEFPLSGHSVRAFSPCASHIVADFVSHPTQALETSCADRPAPIRFLPRRQTP